MSDGSKIEWLHGGAKKAATLNPTTGCVPISPGCKNCYAKREWIRLSANPKSIYYGRRFEDVAMHPGRLMIPRLAMKPRRYFVDSMSDLFHDAITDEFLYDFFDMVEICSHHTFIVLTKRAERMRNYFLGEPRALSLMNLQIGVSVESRDYLHRVDALRATPAAVRVISAEPLLGDLGEFDLSGIHQVFAGGETGPRSRPSAPAWFRSLRDLCARQGVAFFFKQWGDWLPEGQRPGASVPLTAMRPSKVERSGDFNYLRVGKRVAGRMLDAVHHDELVT